MRPLVPAEGLLLLEGLLLTVGLLVLVRPEMLDPTRPVVLLPVVGRLDELPTLALLVLLVLLDMLPLVVLPFCTLWLIEPAVPLSPWRTLAT